MSHTQKITLEVPRALLERAQSATGSTITATVREGLERIATDPVYHSLLALRGTLSSEQGWKELKDDRG